MCNLNVYGMPNPADKMCPLMRKVYNLSERAKMYGIADLEKRLEYIKDNLNHSSDERLLHYLISTLLIP